MKGEEREGKQEEDVARARCCTMQPFGWYAACCTAEVDVRNPSTAALPEKERHK